MKTFEDFEARMIAPCGLNCAACYAHLRRKNTCAGCHAPANAQQAYCARCAIRLCVQKKGLAFCFECGLFPCTLMKKIDKRYRLGYGVSLIENQLRIKAAGMERFLAEEKVRWTCPACGGVISQHAKACTECGRPVETPAGH